MNVPKSSRVTARNTVNPDEDGVTWMTTNAVILFSCASSFQTFLSATQIWICWTPCNPCLKQHMIKIIIA